MASSILSDNGVTSGSAGLKTSADSTGVLALQTTTAGGTATTALTIDTSQNVGIGTASPAGRIDSYGDSTNPAGVFRRGGAYGNIESSDAGRANRWTIGRDNASTGNFVIAYNDSTKTSIDTSGNVGIGTTSPSYKLDVTGSARITSASPLWLGTTSGDSYIQYGASATTANNWTLGSQGDGTFRFFNGTYASGTERMRINSSGYVGIGTTAPETKVQIEGTADTVGATLRITSTGVCSAGMAVNATGLFFAADTGGFVWKTGAQNLPTTSGTERMRIDSSGKVTVGSTAQTKGNLNLYGPASTQLNLYLFKNTQVEAYMGFNSSDSNLYVNTGATFASTGVYMANGGTSWTTNSDERLKENLVPITDAITKVSSLRTVIGNFIADENKTARPFLIAQDVQAVLPEAVSTSTMNETEYLGVSYTDVIPLLVASIKELKQINDTQAETINALTARIVAIESRGTV